ncbi:Os12g0409800, partial [Oryza sativa Japonica Group]
KSSSEFGQAAAALRVVSSLGASLRRSSNTSTTVDGLFRFKSFHTLVRRGFRLLGSVSFLWSATSSSVVSADEVEAAC